jgi:hypothetical protein
MSQVPTRGRRRDNSGGDRSTAGAVLHGLRRRAPSPWLLTATGSASDFVHLRLREAVRPRGGVPPRARRSKLGAPGSRSTARRLFASNEREVATLPISIRGRGAGAIGFPSKTGSYSAAVVDARAGRRPERAQNGRHAATVAIVRYLDARGPGPDTGPTRAKQRALNRLRADSSGDRLRRSVGRPRRAPWAPCDLLT